MKNRELLYKTLGEGIKHKNNNPLMLFMRLQGDIRNNNAYEHNHKTIMNNCKTGLADANLYMDENHIGVTIHKLVYIKGCVTLMRCAWNFYCQLAKPISG